MIPRRLAVVGASGLVGRTMVEVLSGRPLSDRPVDLVVHRHAPEAVRLPRSSWSVHSLSQYDFTGVELALFCLDEEGTRVHLPRALEAGAWVVDNSSLHRLEPDVPLLVPGVNDAQLARRGSLKLVANPNCSTIQLVHVLAPLERRWGLEEVVVATYQSVSGAGREALEDFLASRLQPLGETRPVRGIVRPIVADVVPEIGSLGADGSSREESKIVHETRRILDRPDLRVRATAVRVPVAVGHGEAVFVRLSRPATHDDVISVLRQSPLLRVCHETGPGMAPTPRVDAAGRDDVAVGRLRCDTGDPRDLAFWVVADNLRRGAATNAIEIAERLLEGEWDAKSAIG